MLSFKQAFAAVGMVAMLAGGTAVTTVAHAQTYPAESGCSKIENPTQEQKGWCLAINRRMGNCLACHTMMLNPWPEGFPPGGNIAPPLVSMKARFPDAEKLRAQIYDATAVNPGSRMPPFGKHKVLSDEEIDAIVAFLMTI